VAEQVPALKELLEMRRRLTELVAKMQGNDELDRLLGEVMSNTEKALALAKQRGIEPAAAPEAPKPEDKP
jgi:type VI secretion system protein ImpB